MAVKIVIVGGGSAYMTSMFASLERCSREGALRDAHVALVDINPDAVELMGTWGQAVSEKLDLGLTFEHTTDLESALDGADFVLSTFRTAGLDHRYLDETIPLKYNELGNETVGVGGTFMALRGVPEAVRLAEAIQRRCPRAWLINYTNPAHMITTASIRAGHARTIGLCDGVCGVRWLCCKLLGVDVSREAEIEAYVAGVNHCTWSLGLAFEGRDLYEEMDDLIDRADLSGKGGWEDIGGTELNVIEVDACRLYRRFGILPGSIYYARYYYALRKTIDRLREADHQHRSSWLIERGQAKREWIRNQLETGDLSFRPMDTEDASHGDQAIGTIHAIANDTGRLEVVNVVNQGAVPNLPDDAIVEVTGRLSAQGATAFAAGPLPRSVEGMVRDACTFGELSVEAALSGDRDLVLQAVMAHPAHRDLDTIEPVLEEMFEAHKDYLPRFFRG